MLIELTLKLIERVREKKGNMTIKGSGMKISLSKTTLEDARQQSNIFKI